MENKIFSYIKKNKNEILFLILYILVFCFVLNLKLFTWDKGIWYDKINYISENKIPYYETDEKILGVSEYPISFTYFLLLFVPFVKYLSKELFYIIFGLIQIFSIFGTYFLFKKFEIKKSKTIVFLLMPLNLFLANSRFDGLVLFLIVSFLYFFQKKRYVLFSIFSSFTFFLKIFPIAFFISFYKKILKNKKIIRSLILISLILNLFIFINPKTFLYPFIKTENFRIQSLFGFLNYLGFSLPNIEFINYVLMGCMFIFSFLFSKKSFGFMISIISLLILTSKFFSPQWFIIILGLLIFTNVNESLLLIVSSITLINFMFFWSIGAFTPFELNFHHLVFIFFTLCQHIFLYWIYFYSIFKKNILSNKKTMNKFNCDFNILKKLKKS